MVIYDVFQQILEPPPTPYYLVFFSQFSSLHHHQPKTLVVYPFTKSFTPSTDWFACLATLQ